MCAYPTCTTLTVQAGLAQIYRLVDKCISIYTGIIL